MDLDLQKIQALCFDVDGTLSDTDDQYVLKFEKFFRPIKFLLRDQDAHHAARHFVMWSEAPGNLLLGIPDTLGLDDELASLADRIARRRPKPLKHFLLIEGVQEMLATLYGKYPMSVVTARGEEGTLQFLEQYDLLRYFNVVVTALTAEHTKPYADPIIHAAQVMGVAPEHCLMIGDTTVDMRAGKAAGAQTVGVLCGFGEEAELRNHGANLILETTATLDKVLLGE